ncbi:MAG: hypothetical protein CVT69_01060 [Actinobacteria bacterium HGW-Actinobacteria-9]|nr:MAG: hypothetical protein CVT69_01060 [Actinobacteria bacterium HGW-Actinobacteria-9]
MGARADSYGSRIPAGKGGVVASVDEAGPAGRAGMVPGDIIIEADGHRLTDIIDWRWHTDEARVTLTLDSGRTVELTREPGEAWGLDFADVLFDRVHTCRNDCAFCFMSQLPKGLRPALYLRDDDYRLSFLQGNFVTLTNLDDADVERIAEQVLSPLYVSLHAVDPAIRAQLVCARDDTALQRFDELLSAGIELHVQIVLVPGVNDGEQLDATLTWLAEREGVASVGIVPLGYTRHQSAFKAGYEDRISSVVVIEQVQRWQFAMREREGVTWVHLADEFYLNARAPFPKTEWYDDFPQYENGIGIVRSFVDEVTTRREEYVAALGALPTDAESVTLVTGMLAATTLAGALQACEGVGRVRLLAVPNRFFGGNVTVTGLLTGVDIAAAIVADGEEGTYLVPDIVLNSECLTLDDWDIERIRRESDSDVRLVSCTASGLLQGLRDSASNDFKQVR